MSGEQLHHLLGAYLLGGLDAADTGRFQEHLNVCAECRHELEELKNLPSLLEALPVPDAVALTWHRSPEGENNDARAVPPALLDGLVVRRRKSRRRWSAFVGAVAAACLAIGFVAAPLLNQPPKPDASYSVQASSGLQVTVGLVKKNWGTELALEGRSMPLNGTLSLWVKDRAGVEDRACAWTATPSGRIRVTGATPVQLTSISEVELRDDRQQAVAVISVPDSPP
ncbi:anti-sigma factor family protein [Arthrobacter rhizosphaerae]|uniref:anti-sigma factor family protein n=1 Tax=Arthrobacter rhizosphaerae TaxID=2855490 RepID=UPI001FF1B65B|nr:zf-HC2 domain-containing protein [Arthrobacter rhizosphaerae]